ncbi:MAG TPA: UbiA family prenyltransferase [Rhizomicrobium sp.]|nr:UbiA family prenyltransferase [Rhizomicrobium sp.]
MKNGQVGHQLVPASAVTQRRIWLDLLLYPTHSLPTAAAPVVIAVAVAFRHHLVSLLPALLGFVASWFVHIAGLFYDNYELLVRYPDNREHPELVQAYWDGDLTSSSLARAIIACLVLALLTGPYLWAVAGWPVAMFGLIGIVASLSYAGGPLAYARFGLSEIVFFAMFGVVGEVGIYYVQAASVLGAWRQALATLPPEIWVLGLPAGALCVNILLIDDMRDREADAAKGWRTGAVRFGPRWARAGCVVTTCFAYAAPLLFWRAFGFSAWILLPWVTLPLAIWILRTLYTTLRLEDLEPVTPRGAFLVFFYSAFLAVGVAIPS